MLRRGDGLESLTFCLTLRLLTFSLRPRCGSGPVSLRLHQGLKTLFLRLDTPLLQLRCSLDTLTLRLESLSLRLYATLLNLSCLAKHITYQLIYGNERIL